MVTRSRLVALGLVVSLALVLSASVGTTAGEPDGDELLDKAVDSLANEPVEAVHTQEIARPDGQMTQTVAIHKDDSESAYLEILDETETGAGQQMVVDGSTVWRQNLEDETAVQYDTSNQHLFDEFRTLGAAPAEVSDHYKGEFKGTSEVDGRESYVVELVPPEERTAGLSLDIDAGNIQYEVPLHEASEQRWYISQETWWIDRETYYPLKQSVEWVDEDGNIIASATREYEELTVGSDVDTNTTDESPADEILTELENMSTSDDESQETTTQADDGIEIIESETYDSRQAVNESIPFALPEVDIPNEFEFARASLESHEEQYTVVLWYENEESESSLSVQIAESEASFSQYNMLIEQEEISEFDGEIVVTDSGTAVVRRCGDLTYQVRGPPDAETLIEVATSMAC